MGRSVRGEERTRGGGCARARVCQHRNLAMVGGDERVLAPRGVMTDATYFWKPEKKNETHGYE